MKYKRFEAISVRPVERGHMKSIAFAILVLAIIVVIISSTSCFAATDVHSSIVERSLTLPQFVNGVVARSAQLTYITEQDSEVFAFYRNTPVKEVTDTVFLTLLRRPSETRIIQQSWTDFFRVRTSNDPTGQWRELQEYLEANLSNLTIFRIPRDAPYGAQYDLYAVGVFNKNIVVGVQMFGVAT